MSNITKDDRARRKAIVRGLKGLANEAKSRLISLEAEVRNASPKEADRLWSIIGRLEAWQNS